MNFAGGLRVTIKDKNLKKNSKIEDVERGV